MNERRIGPRVIAVAAAATLVAGLAATALAHTHVAESSPAAGERVDAAPSEVMVRFGDDFLPQQPGAVSDARLEVYDACGTQVDKGDSALTMEDSRVVVGSGGDTAGRYEIHWFVTAADGAAQSGVIDFTVKAGRVCTSAARPDAAKDVDLGFDFTSIASKRVKGGALVSVTTAAPVKCAELTEKQTMELRFDTNGDQLAEIKGELVCVAGAVKVRLSNDDGVTGTLRTTRPKANVLAVKIKRHVLLGHVDVYAQSSLDSSDCDGKVCADRAPDLGSVRGY